MSEIVSKVACAHRGIRFINENNIESNRIVKSLYQYLCGNDYESEKKYNSLSESIEIIKKYIKED